MVPAFYEGRDKRLSVIMLNVLLCYVQCLAKNNELEQLVSVTEEIQPWRVLDEDMTRFKWLVSFLIHTTTRLLVKKPDMTNEEGNLTAKLSAVILLEHRQVSTVNVTQELGTLIKLENFSTHDFLWTVLDYVAKKTEAERQRSEDTKEWDVDSTYRSCLMQLEALEQRSCLHPTLCKKIRSTISDKLPPKILSKQDKSLKYIATGRKFRLEGIERLDDTIETLDKAISAIGDLQSKKNDEYGAACHVRAQTLCLRALCTNEKLRNSEDCIQDIKEAIKLWLDRDYCQFVADHTSLSLTTVKLLCYVCDMILLEVKIEGDKEIFEMMTELFNQSSNGVKECVAMLWQSRSRSHALCTSHETHTFFKTVLKSYEEEWISSISKSNDIKAICTSTDTDNLKHVAFELERKEPATTKSSYLAAHIYYDLGDRMILQGSLTEALGYANKSRMLRVLV